MNNPGVENVKKETPMEMPGSRPPFATGNVDSRMTGKRVCRSLIPASPRFATAGTRPGRRQVGLTGLGADVPSVSGGPDPNACQHRSHHERPQYPGTPPPIPRDHHRLITLLSLPQIHSAGNSSALHPRTRIPWSSHPGFRQSRADVRRPISHEGNRHDATLHGGWPGCHGCRRREIKNLIPTSPARFRLDGIGSTGLGPDIGSHREVGTRDGSLLEGERGALGWFDWKGLEMSCVAWHDGSGRGSYFLLVGPRELVVVFQI